MKKLFLLFLAFTTAIGISQTAENYFKPLKYRNIGPFRGEGRLWQQVSLVIQ